MSNDKIMKKKINLKNLPKKKKQLKERESNLIGKKTQRQLNCKYIYIIKIDPK